MYFKSYILNIYVAVYPPSPITGGIPLSIWQLFHLACYVTRRHGLSTYLPMLCFLSRRPIDRKLESLVDKWTDETA